ncbi:hypothetical protein FACS189490_00760 [Clostridia bacterium]|nr:hypothetical protein FACS189490_00760 [Clostridia bacterium]
MVKLHMGGAFIKDGKLLGKPTLTNEQARKNTIAYRILTAHNNPSGTGANGALRIKFDALASHDITYVGIIQTARASGLTRFPVKYVLTNCHNTLCSVGGTINEDDHVFGLSAAKKYGGVYVPAHFAVIHQYMREREAFCGGMILGSDSHTRYGALGTMGIGEGGGELAKQLLGKTYDIAFPKIIGVRLIGAPKAGVGPQDVSLAIIKDVFDAGFVKNAVMEFFGEGISSMDADYRCGIDVMTTETTCLSTIWETDEKVRDWYAGHGREAAYKELKVTGEAYYDGLITVDLSAVVPMIALPFHPKNAYTVRDFNDNAKDIIERFDRENNSNLSAKIRDGKFYADQAVAAGCAGGTFSSLCAAADELNGASLNNFNMSVYPASQPVFAELVENGVIGRFIRSGVTVRSAFCGPCFGAGDTPANGAFSLRHATRNFPNREGSKPKDGQSAFVALADARTIAATAANGGAITAAEGFNRSTYAYRFDDSSYSSKVYDGFLKADANEPLIFGPNIADWPQMPALLENILLETVCVIEDEITTTDELIPSGETSSYRSNPLKLAEFALSRRSPEYVGLAKAVKTDKTRFDRIFAKSGVDPKDTLTGSVIYAKKPGDGSAREQAASCQKVLGGLANIAKEYATKRYRSNLINWGIIPFTYPLETPVAVGSFVLAKNVLTALKEGKSEVSATVYEGDTEKDITLSLGSLTGDERGILISGCLINYYR